MDSRKVIIRGHIFDYEEKAPFMVSGASVLGAIEYDAGRDMLRCHECGEWFSSVCSHAVAVHKLSGSDYKRRHGLRLRSSLISRKLASDIAQNLRARAGGNTMHGFRSGHTPKASAPRALRQAHNWEKKNEDGRCRAQLIFKIQTLAARLQHTPTVAEMDSAGINHCSLRQVFDGLPTNAIVEMAGLKPNVQGNSREAFSNEHLLAELLKFHMKYGRIPSVVETQALNLPSRTAYVRAFGNMTNACKLIGVTPPKLNNERMPWPKEYFGGVTPDIALQRITA